MINTLIPSTLRIVAAWYFIGFFAVWASPPGWAEDHYTRIQWLMPWVPDIEFKGIHSALKVQISLLIAWTVPLLMLWLGSVSVGLVFSELQGYIQRWREERRLQPSGKFWGVEVASYSIGKLPMSTTPLGGTKVSLTPGRKKDVAYVNMSGDVAKIVNVLTPKEKALCEELLSVLIENPEHYAGDGHGVGLLEHTLNVVTEVAPRCTPDFRLPFIAAIAHDIGKLITFRSDGKGGWVRRGLHSRESARILFAMPSFQLLTKEERNALMLSIKYDHNPSKMPRLEGESDSHMLAMRIIHTLSVSDRAATAGEKDRVLERVSNEDMLWFDFVTNLREVPMVKPNAPGKSNQINYPSGEYLYIYENAWRDAAIKRMPPQIAAALDLHRRDVGKLAKYTERLLSRLRKEGVLVEEADIHTPEGLIREKTSEANPMWDIRSGRGEKAAVIRGVIVLRANPLWQLLNYKLAQESHFPVQIVSQNTKPDGDLITSDRLVPSDIFDIDESADPNVLKESIKGTKVSLDNELGTSNIKRRPAPSRATAKGVIQKAKNAAVSAASTDNENIEASVTPDATEVEAREVDIELAEMQAAAEMAATESQEKIEVSESNQGRDAALSFFAKSTIESHSQIKAAPPPDEPQPAITQPRAKPAGVSLAARRRAAVIQNNKVDVPPLDRPLPVRAKSVNAPKPVEQQPASPSNSEQVAPAAAPTPPDSQVTTQSEQAPIGVANAEVIAKFPHLAIGDKFYTAAATAVKNGTKKEGERYHPKNKGRRFS